MSATPTVYQGQAPLLPPPCVPWPPGEVSYLERELRAYATALLAAGSADDDAALDAMTLAGQVWCLLDEACDHTHDAFTSAKRLAERMNTMATDGYYSRSVYTLAGAALRGLLAITVARPTLCPYQEPTHDPNPSQSPAVQRPRQPGNRAGRG